MENNIETLEHQTAPESTRGLFDSPPSSSTSTSDKKFPPHRESASVPDKRRSLNNKPTTNSFSQTSRGGGGGHQRSRSSSDLFNNGNNNMNGRRNNNFGLHTLVEEEKSNLDSLQEMINTLKNLPPIISPNNTSSSTSQHQKGHRKQHSMSSLVTGNSSSGHGNNNNYHQVTNSNKRLSYNNNNVSDHNNMQFGGGDMENRQQQQQRRPTHSRRSSTSDFFDNNNKKDVNIFNTLSRDEALAEAEAKLMGTFTTVAETKKSGSRRSSVDNMKYSPPNSCGGSRRYSESPISTPLSSSTSTGLLSSKRTSLPMPTLSENMVATNGGASGSRRIQFNKPLNLSGNSTKEDVAEGNNKRLSAGGHSRRSSRNLDFDWRSSSSSSAAATTTSASGNNNNRNSIASSFQLVPFTPTRVNFARDDANPHQRRPLFIAHLPFSALPPLFRSRQLSRGALRVNKRNRSDAYVYCEDLDDDIYICGSRDRNRALEGDVVAVRLVDVDKVLREKKEKEEAKLVRNGGQAKVRLPDEEDENEIIFGGDEDVETLKPKYCGVVVAILERAQNQVFSGTLTLMRPNNKRAQEEKAAEEARKSILGKDALIQKEAPRIVWFKSTDKRVPLIAIPIEQAPHDFVENSEAYNTSLFVGSMKRWPITSLHPFGTLERELGSVYELSTQTKAIFADNNVTDSDFSEAVQSCLPSIPFNLEEIDASRRDLRHDTVTFTIDTKGSNVVDDALSIKKLEEDTWEVGVHISDVTYFIKSQSALDKEARARAVRVDLIHTHVPMIPEILTEQVTNLSPNESRFTFSVIWKINSKGEIQDTWFGKTIIKSAAQLTYDDAQKILENASAANEQISKDIHSLHQLSTTLREKRYSNGVFTQKRDELEYEFQDEEPVTVSIYHKNDAAKMVKEFLYLANKSVAQRISSQFPNHALLRRHAPPNERKIRELCDYTSRHLGVQLDNTNASTLEASIQAIQDPKLRKLVSVIVLKTLQAPKYFCSGSVDIAKYSHYALNIPLFTHFTAPSRRFADIIVHRQLEATLVAGEKRFSLDRDTVQKLAQHCNVKRDAAIYAREQSSLMFLSIHMNKLSQQQQQIPQAITAPSVIFREAIVVAVFDQYFDIIIPELNLEKRIHLACLPVWRSDYNEQNQSLTMFWRKGVDTSTGKKVNWNLSDEEDDEEDDMDDEALLEEMNQHSNPSPKENEEAKKEKDVDEEIVLEEYKNTIYSESESVVSRLAIKHQESAANNNNATISSSFNQQVIPNKSISTPVLMNRRPETSRSSNRRASIVRARLSDSTAFSTEQGYQTIKALDKIRVVLIIELVRTPPVIRILAANPFS